MLPDRVRLRLRGRVLREVVLAPHVRDRPELIADQDERETFARYLRAERAGGTGA